MCRILSNSFLYEMIIMLFLLFKKSFIFPLLGLCRCAWTFSSCGVEADLQLCVGSSLPSGCSCHRAQALECSGFIVTACGLNSRGSWALQLGLSGCGTWASLSVGSSQARYRTRVTGIGGRFLSTVPPGKSCFFLSVNNVNSGFWMLILPLMEWIQHGYCVLFFSHIAGLLY